jgi:hypothetical protein
MVTTCVRWVLRQGTGRQEPSTSTRPEQLLGPVMAGYVMSVCRSFQSRQQRSSHMIIAHARAPTRTHPRLSPRTPPSQYGAELASLRLCCKTGLVRTHRLVISSIHLFERVLRVPKRWAREACCGQHVPNQPERLHCAEPIIPHRHLQQHQCTIVLPSCINLCQRIGLSACCTSYMLC